MITVCTECGKRLTRAGGAWVSDGAEAVCPDGYPHDPATCLDGRGDSEGCAGEVEYRMPLSGTGKSFPRCAAHWEARLEVQAGIDARYPSHPPADWSPLDAGESWYEDE